MSRQLIDLDIRLINHECLLQMFAKRGDVALDLLQPRLVEVAAALGKKVDGELLRRGSGDVVGFRVRGRRGGLGCGRSVGRSWIVLDCIDIMDVISASISLPSLCRGREVEILMHCR